MLDIEYPMSAAGGDIVISQPTTSQQALSVLLTIQGERPLNRDYGTPPYLFESTIDTGLPVDLHSPGTYLINTLRSP